MALCHKVFACLLILVVSTNARKKPCSETKALQAVQVSTFIFSNKLTEVIAKQSGNHFVVSPFSIWNLLRVLLMGAGGKTLSKLRQELKYPRRYCEHYLQYDKWLQNKNQSVTLERGGLMVFDNSVNITEKFEKNVKDSGMESISQSCETRDEIADYINTKVKNATHGLISSVVDPEGLQNKLLILIDFMYFNGEWKIPFYKQETQEQHFFNEEKVPIGKVNMMFLNDKFKVKVVDEIQARVLEIPYASDRFSMLVFLPLANVSLQTVQQAMTMTKPMPKSIFEFGPKTPVILEIPRFKMDFKIDDLKDVLSDIGLSELFSSEADFSGITDQPIHLSGFSHKCVLEVTEVGTVASTVTEADYEDRIAPPNFKANSPFLYMIVENQKKVILFVGAYSKPTLY